MTIRPKDRKLAELILFISERSEGDPTFGEEKLIKLLFNADFSAVRMFQRSITRQEYEKRFACPAPKRLAAVRKSLVERGELAIRVREPFGSKQNRTFALRLANLNEFSPEEIALVTKLISENRERTVPNVRNLSEEICGWEEAETGETIPDEVAYLSKRPPNENDLRHCQQAAALAAAVLSGDRKVHLIDAETFFHRGVRQPTRRSRTARSSNQSKSAGPDVASARKAGVRRATRRKSPTLVRRDA